MLVAAGTYVAQDLRDADGLLRPALRRAALSCSLSERRQLRRLGNAYLRLDPPQSDVEASCAVAVKAAPEGPAALPAPGPDAGPTIGRPLE